MANGFSLSLLKFVGWGFSEKRASLLMMCLALLLFQGCATLQRSSEIAAPTETTAQPTPSQPCPLNRWLKKVPLWKRHCHKPDKLRGMGRSIKENRRPAEAFMIKPRL